MKTDQDGQSHEFINTRRMLSFELTDEERLQVDGLRRIHHAHCNNGNILRVESEFRKFMIKHAATTNVGTRDRPDEYAEKHGNTMEGEALVISAPSFAGKSHVLDRLNLHPRLAGYTREDGTERRVFIKLVAPSPCTLKTLGLEILRQLDAYPIERNPAEHIIWHRVRRLFIARGINILQIEEFQNTLDGRHDGERLKLANAMRNLLVGTVVVPPPPAADAREKLLVNDHGEKHPVFLIIAGTPSVLKFTRDRSEEAYDQFSRRCKEAPFEEIPRTKPDRAGTSQYKGLVEFIENAQTALGFPHDERLTTPDMLDRFYKASGKQFGRLMHMLKEAAREIVLTGDGSLYDLLPWAFEQTYRTGDLKNCFLVPDIDKCPEPPAPRRGAVNDTTKRLVDALGERP